MVLWPPGGTGRTPSDGERPLPVARRAVPATVRDALSAVGTSGADAVVVVLGSSRARVRELLELLDEVRPHARAVVLDADERPDEHPDERPHERSSAGAEPPIQPDVEVRVLGPVEVLGTEGSLARHPKLTELIVYLAMHPDGATGRTWSAALWPDRRVPQQTIANRVSEARHALGFAEDERPRMRRVGERHLLVDTPVDLDRFRSLSGPGTTPDQWRAALDLVRGRPFEGLQHGHWVALEGHATEAEHLVAKVALALGLESLRAHEGEAAAWAAQRGMRAAPFDERLHRLAMRAAFALGNRAGVADALERLAVILELEGDPLAGVHPETAALYERLRASL